MPSFDEVTSFCSNLAKQLAGFGIPVFTNYQFAKTGGEVDLYLPGRPRLAVDIKGSAPREIERPDLVPPEIPVVLITLDASGGETSINLRSWRFWHVQTTLGDWSRTADSLVRICIKQELDGVVHALDGFHPIPAAFRDTTDPIASAASSLLMNLGHQDIVEGARSILANPKVGPSIREALPWLAQVAGEKAIVATPSVELAPSVRSAEDQRKRLCIRKTTQAILVSIGELVRDDRYLQLAAELNAIQQEFDSDHFTSCALRVGRALELSVYVLAAAWGVQVESRIIGLVSKLEGMLGQLNSSLLDYRNATEEKERFQMKQRVQTHTSVDGSLIPFRSDG